MTDSTRVQQSIDGQQTVSPNFDPMNSNGLVLTPAELDALRQMRGQFPSDEQTWAQRQLAQANPLNRLDTKHVEVKLLPRLPLAKTVGVFGLTLAATFYGGWNVGYTHAEPASTTAPVDAAGKVQAPNP